MELRTGTWLTVDDDERPRAINVRRCRLEVTRGPSKGTSVEVASDVITIGAHPRNDLVIRDRTVSGAHLEIRPGPKGYVLRDLDSRNGTYVYDLRIGEAVIPPGAPIVVGKSEIHFRPLETSAALPLWEAGDFGSLIGGSVVMRRLYAQLDRIAASDATVLVNGETGTGKELVAEAVHRHSPRASGPFVVFDCAGVPPSLFESELFGHVAGAFTGAVSSRVGAFERASGGTLFLDEIGELPVEQQAKLLRCVQSRRIRRVGGSRDIDCDVRIVAATNRDLAVEVNRGNFREDLYYRLNVARVVVPPLRDRREDIPELVAQFARQAPYGAERGVDDAVIRSMMDYYWPGNVRELRNAVERVLAVPSAGFEPLDGSGPHLAPDAPEPVSCELSVDVSIPFKDAKADVIEAFERTYVTALLQQFEWNVAAAARATGLDRVSLYRMLSRLGIERPS